MESTESTSGNTKISDSAYSNSCSNNSQSQRSGSSHSNSHSRSSGSSGSSGYGGKPQANNVIPQPLSKRTTKDRKKKKLKSIIQNNSSTIADNTQQQATIIQEIKCEDNADTSIGNYNLAIQLERSIIYFNF